MSNLFIRTHYQQVADRLNEPRKLIQAIYGPRQVGKTTVVTQVLKDLKTPHLFVSADDTNVCHGKNFCKCVLPNCSKTIA
ncbi:MAG: AAA family ATPase [Cyclobacteriaceae bacterium]|nr:AAA family ATPase [Cyclobacteriaceae bacterium]